MIFDSHAHYDDHQFDEDRDELIKKLYINNVKRIVNVSAELSGIERAIELADKYDYIYASVGVHPDEVGELSKEHTMYIKEKALHPKVVAIGEIGLDYYEREGEAPKDRQQQKQWFINQLDIAKELNKPVIIHSRDACEDTLEIIKNYKDLKMVMHCYSYSKETAKELMKSNMIFGIGGVVTFKNSKKLKEALEVIPIENILLETDCPYLAPVPFRGKRNQSDYINYVIEEIANIKNMNVSQVEEICWKNTCDFYGLSVN